MLSVSSDVKKLSRSLNQKIEWREHGKRNHACRISYDISTEIRLRQLIRWYHKLPEVLRKAGVILESN